MAGSLKTRVINMVASSKATRSLISSLAKPVIAFAAKHQKKPTSFPAVKAGVQAKDAVASASLPAPTAEFEGKKARAKAAAVVMSAERGGFAYAATGMRAFSSLEEKLVKSAMKSRVNSMFKQSKKYAKARRTSKTKRGKRHKKSKKSVKLSTRRKSRNLKSYQKLKNKKTAFVEEYGIVPTRIAFVGKSTASLYRPARSRAIVRPIPLQLLQMKRNADAVRFLQIIEEEAKKKGVSKRVVIGGAFLLLGFSAANTLVPGSFVVFLIIAGVVMLLLPLLKRLQSMVEGGGAGRGEGSSTRPKWSDEEEGEEEGVAFEHEKGLRSGFGRADESDEE